MTSVKEMWNKKDPNFALNLSDLQEAIDSDPGMNDEDLMNLSNKDMVLLEALAGNLVDFMLPQNRKPE